MKVLCCGDREWQNMDVIRRELEKFNTGTIIVEGECRGADIMSRKVAENLGFTVLPYPADWNKYPRAAGVIRNQEMLDKNPDIELVLAFHDNIEHSKGTADMLRRATKKGIKTKIICSF